MNLIALSSAADMTGTTNQQLRDYFGEEEIQKVSGIEMLPLELIDQVFEETFGHPRSEMVSVQELAYELNTTRDKIYYHIRKGEGTVYSFPGAYPNRARHYFHKDDVEEWRKLTDGLRRELEKLLEKYGIARVEEELERFR